MSRSTKLSLPLTSVLLCEWHWQSALRPELAQENVFRDFWGQMLCRFLHKYQTFGGVYCLHLQGVLVIFRTTLNMMPVCQSVLAHNPRILNTHWPHCSSISHSSSTIVLIFVQAL